MSQKRDKTVPQLVEKYRREFPDLEKRFIRRLILAEHKELFKNNDSEVRKLTRYLEKAFDIPKPKTEQINSNDNSKDTKNVMGLFAYFDKRAERKRLEQINEDIQHERITNKFKILHATDAEINQLRREKKVVSETDEIAIENKYWLYYNNLTNKKYI